MFVSFWPEKKCNCPSCNLQIALGEEHCVHCGYPLSKVEIDKLKNDTDQRFKHSALVGLIVFSLVTVIAVIVEIILR